MARYRTAAQEKADEMREIDAPLVGNFSAGDWVGVDRAWLKHWSFKNAPRPTQSLWRKLVEERFGRVEKTDQHGNVWVLDRFGQMHGGSYPVPARFVRLKEAPERERPEMGARKEWDPRVKTQGRRKKKDLRAPYDDRLPSMPPFMWVERHERVGDLGVLAYGAYNAMGLIGSEEGGVAIVFEHPEKAVLATKAIPWDPEGRDVETDRIVAFISSLGRLRPATSAQLTELVMALRDAGYGVRT